MSNSSFVYIHIYMYIYVHVSMYQMAPVDVAWSDLAKHCPWSKGQLIGMGSTVPLGTVPLVIDVVVVVKVFLLDNGDISLIFQDISMKLGGHIGHGPNSSYHHS